MKFNVYMIDDHENKVIHLNTFLDWLRVRFSQTGLMFSCGFENPLEASQSARAIQKALEDPLGVILLDVGMSGQAYERAATDLRSANSALVSTAEAELFRTTYLISEPTARLAATIAVIAKKRNTRVAWCSRIENQAVHTHFGEAFPQIFWPLNDPPGTMPWTTLDANKMQVVLKPYHSDNKINDGVCFALKPGLSLRWDHNSLMTPGLEHYTLLSSWLGLINHACDGESAKALLCPNGECGWQVRGSTNAYTVEAGIVESACGRLGVTLSCEHRTRYRLPFQPGLPFLLSLADLCWQMKQVFETTYPPQSVVLSRVNGVHLLRLNLKPKTKGNESVDMDRFERTYNQIVAGKSPGYHATSVKLQNLSKAKIQLQHGIDFERSALFDGVQDGNVPNVSGPNVSISFDKDQQSPAVLIKWETDNL